MQWSTLFRSRKSAARRRITRPRLSLEQLEVRCLLSYNVIDVPISPVAINSAGQIAGVYSNQAAVWQNGVVTYLGAGNNSSADGITDAGQVVGRYAVGNTSHGFVWDSTSGLRDLGPLASTPYSDARGINSAGQAVGVSGQSSNWYPRAVLWDNAGAAQDLGTFGLEHSTAAAINDGGRVVGWAYNGSGEITSDQHVSVSQAFLWDASAGGALLGWLPGHAASVGSDINNGGQVVGSSGDFVWQPNSRPYRPLEAFLFENGTMTGLGHLPGDLRSSAKAVNQAGQVIGTSMANMQANDYGRPFLWQAGVMAELNSLIVPSSGWSVSNARDINDRGMIIGGGSNSTRTSGIVLIPDTIPTLTVNDPTVNEGNTGTKSAIFTLTLSIRSDQPVTISYATANGTAVAGSDYQAASGSVAFAPGETSKTITIQVIGDRLPESNEAFVLNLSTSSTGIIIDGQALAAITDDEPRISISDVSKAEGKKGQTTLFTFTVTLSVAYDQAVTMSFRTVNGTATSNGDYIARTGTLTFAPGETTKTITIEVKGDSTKEANETFYLDLFGNSSNSLVTKNRGLGTILNDD